MTERLLAGERSRLPGCENTVLSHSHRLQRRKGTSMLFNSFGYAAFLPIVFLLYWLVPKKGRWVLLLMASYWFYASWGVEYVAVLLITTALSYTAGILMENAGEKKTT